MFALGHKKEVLAIFYKLLYDFDDYKDEYVSLNNLANPKEEAIWQDFFEKNTWIFGHGLCYRFLHKAHKNLETTTTGAAFDTPGKRVDGLMKTKAEISQYVLIEIKKPTDPLLKSQEVRSGCWPVSNEVNDAVAQIQKTAFEFSHRRLKTEQKDDNGQSTGEFVYSILPKAYLVIGRLEDLCKYDDKIVCFELFRKSQSTLEIITYDELYNRAECIVKTLTDCEDPYR